MLKITALVAVDVKDLGHVFDLHYSKTSVIPSKWTNRNIKNKDATPRYFMAKALEPSAIESIP
jgi:hypothetical protein